MTSASATAREDHRLLCPGDRPFAKHFQRSPEQIGPEEIPPTNCTSSIRNMPPGQRLIKPSVPCVPLWSDPATARRRHHDSLRQTAQDAAGGAQSGGGAKDLRRLARHLAAHADPRDLRLRAAQFSEVVHLRVADINSARMVVHVRQGKGQKDRLVALSAVLLAELRTYWRPYRPAGCLFPGSSAANTLVRGRWRNSPSTCGRWAWASTSPCTHCGIGTVTRPICSKRVSMW